MYREFFIAACLYFQGAACCVRKDLQKAPSLKEVHPLVEAKMDSEQYQIFAQLEWEVDGRITDVKLETLIERAKSVDTAHPVSRLIITERSTQKVLYEQTINDRPLSLCTHQLNEDVGEGLIVKWTGGSADRIEILAAINGQVCNVLTTAYRLDATLLQLSDTTTAVLVTSAEGSGDTFYSTLYVWEGGRYRPIGRTPYKRLIGLIEREFMGQR